MHASKEDEHFGTEQQYSPNGCPANERFNQRLIQCVPNVILFLSPDHLILEFNPAAERLYGRKREDVLGKDYFEEFLPDNAREAVAADIEKVLNGKPTRGFENAVVTNDGQERILRWNIDCVFDSEDKPIGIVAVGQDITERKQSDSALSESLQTSDDIVRTIPSGLFIYKYEAPDTLTLLYGNPEAERLTGIKVADWLGKEFNEIWPNAKEQGTTDAFLSPMKTGQTYETEDLYYKDDKHEGTVRARAFRLPGDKLAVAFENITERKRAEEALRESEERFRTLSEFSPVGVFRTDEQGAVLYTNPQWQRITGLRFEENLGFGWAKALHPGDKDRILEEWDECLREEKGYSGEFRFLAPSGEVRWVHTSTSPIRSARGDIVGHVGMNQEITERKLAEEALKESEKRFRSLSKAAFEGIAFGENGVVVDANDAFIKMYGYSLEELKGKQVRELVAPEHRELVQENIRSGYEGVYEHKGLRKDGSLIDLEIHGHNVIYQGRTIRLTAVRDITERKRAEEKLQEGEQTARALLNATTDSGLLIDREGLIIDLNDRMAEAMGDTRENMIGTVVYDYLPADLAEQRKAKGLKAIRERKPIHFEDQRGNRWLENCVYPVLGPEREVVRFAVYSRDITERRQAADKLRESEERLTKAFLASPNLMGIIDLDEKRRLLVNEAFARVTGYSIEEVTDTTFDELNFWVDPDRAHEAFRSVKQDGILYDYETDIRTKHGEIRTLRYHGALLDIPGTNIVAFSAEDITEQRKVERRIKKYQTQLKSLASELSLAEERERRRIAAGIHDDIAQKLAMAKFELQSLKASVTDADVSGSLEKQCQLMDQVVADARSLTFELSNPVLYQVGLEAAVESYLTERIEGQFGIKCKFKSEGPRSSLEEDIRVVLFQGVRELLANIVKHANASTVEVYVSNTEDELRIVVQDDGVGFDPTEIGPHTIEQGGFGLFNIRERLEYLGGNVKIESGRTKGARVTMTVAIRTDAAAE